MRIISIFYKHDKYHEKDLNIQIFITSYIEYLLLLPKTSFGLELPSESA